VRVLIPVTAAGTIIGRQGANIKRMSEAFFCRMQIADSSDPFGTKERIMSINSTKIMHVCEGVQEIFSRMISEPATMVHVYIDPRTSYPAPDNPFISGQVGF